MSQAAVLQVGTGSIKIEAARKIIASWKRAAGGGTTRKLTETEWRMRLAGAGIGMVIHDDGG